MSCKTKTRSKTKPKLIRNLPGSAGDPYRQIFLSARAVPQVNLKTLWHKIQWSQCWRCWISAWRRCQLVRHLQQVSWNLLLCLKMIPIKMPGMVMEPKISWACGSFSLTGGSQRSLLRRLRWDKRKFSSERILWETNFQIVSPTPSTITHTESNNLFFALRGAGSSYGVVTQFKYKPDFNLSLISWLAKISLRYIVHEVPEAKPAILLAWADNSDDLAAIKAAGQVTNPLALISPMIPAPGIGRLQCHHQSGVCPRFLAKCSCLSNLQVIVDWSTRAKKTKTFPGFFFHQ